MAARDDQRQDDDDRTIKMMRPPLRHQPLWPKRRLWIALPALAAVAALAGIGGWLDVRPRVTVQPIPASIVVLEPAPIPAPLPPLAAQAPARLEFPLGDEATILAARGSDMLAFRFRDDPAVLVLSFPSLRQQGEMLDRLAAFVEKVGLPRSRVLTDAELDAAIRQAGDAPETYYSGHDYRAADMARFFATADRDDIVLNSEETRLRALLTATGMLAPGAVGALISIPPETDAQQIDAASRATILHHELSHGVFFTDPAYAAYARTFWLTVLNETQRGGFRRFLGTDGYDTSNEDLMLNETQAYLIHTADPHYFAPDRAGMTEAEAARLRDIFVRGMPDRWLVTRQVMTK
jgi:hypothetical protein